MNMTETVKGCSFVLPNNACNFVATCKRKPVALFSNTKVSNQGKMLSQQQQHKHLSIKRSFCVNKVLAYTMLLVNVGEKSEVAVKQSLPNPQAVFVDPVSPLSWNLKQATFHVFMNRAKMGKIEKLSNWERISGFVVFFVIIPNNACHVFSDRPTYPSPEPTFCSK